MKNNCTASLFANKPHTGDMRQAEFEQRKRDYMQNMHDRAAVFIEPSKKHADDVKPRK